MAGPEPITPAIANPVSTIAISADKILQIPNIASVRREDKALVVVDDGGKETRIETFSSAQAVRDSILRIQAAIEAFHVNSGQAVSTDPSLIAFIPSMIHAGAPMEPGGVVFMAIGTNIAAGSRIVLSPSIGQSLDTVIGTTMIYGLVSGAVLTPGTYDVELRDSSLATLYDTLTAGLVINAASPIPAVPNNDIWELLADPNTNYAAGPTDPTLPCLYHGSSDGVNYDILYAWKTDTTSWVGIITP